MWIILYLSLLIIKFTVSLQNLCKVNEISMMGELTYFLGLQVKQVNDRFFISQTKYIYDLLKKFDLIDCSSAKTPMATCCPVAFTIVEGGLNTIVQINRINTTK